MIPRTRDATPHTQHRCAGAAAVDCRERPSASGPCRGRLGRGGSFVSNKASCSHSESVHTQWATVLLQPLSGSGERIVVAVAAINDNGERRCLRTMNPAHAKAIFRDEHHYVSDLITFVTDSLDAHLAHAQSLANWEPPLEGVALGVLQQGNASDIDDFVRGAASLSTIFYSDQPQPRPTADRRPG